MAQNDGRQGRGRRCPDPCPRSALGRAAGSAASSPCGQAPGSRDPPGRKPGLRLFAHAPRPRPESTAVPSVRGPRVSHLSSATVRKHQREKSVVNDFYVSDRAPFCAVRRHLVPSALGACDSLRAVWRPRARPPRPHQLARVTVLLSVSLPRGKGNYGVPSCCGPNGFRPRTCGKERGRPGSLPAHTADASQRVAWPQLAASRGTAAAGCDASGRGPPHPRGCHYRLSLPSLTAPN